jgi:hypothetical protein
MAQVPENKVTEHDLSVWFKMAEQLKKLRDSEMVLRKRIFSGFFPEPKEGINRVEISNGFNLEVSYPIERKVDEVALDALTPDDWEKVGLSKDVLIKYKPSLVVSAYRQLTDEQRAIFDQILTIKDGSPSGMKVVKKKES